MCKFSSWSRMVTSLQSKLWPVHACSADKLKSAVLTALLCKRLDEHRRAVRMADISISRTYMECRPQC